MRRPEKKNAFFGLDVAQNTPNGIRLVRELSSFLTFFRFQGLARSVFLPPLGRIDK